MDTILPGLELASSNHVCVFVGFEIRQPHDDGFGIKGGSNVGDAFGEFLNVKINGVVIARNRLIDFGPDVGFQSLVVQERFWMNPDRVVDNEFQPCEADTRVGSRL